MTSDESSFMLRPVPHRAIPTSPIFRELRLPNSPNLERLRDLELDVRIELGRANVSVADVLKLAEGSVIELDKLTDEPVEIYVSDRLVARGELVAVNGNFAVRIVEIVGS